MDDIRVFIKLRQRDPTERTRNSYLYWYGSRCVCIVVCLPLYRCRGRCLCEHVSPHLIDLGL